MLNDIEEVISRFRHDPAYHNIADALRYYNAHDDVRGEKTMVDHFAIPTIISMVGRKHYPDLPHEILVDELIDFTQVFMAANCQGKTVSLHNVDIAGAAQMFERDPISAAITIFMCQFGEYLTTILTPRKVN